jgi:hypothetical protein
MVAAEGGIFCDEITWEQSKDKVEYDTVHRKIQVKGLDSQINVYKPLREVIDSTSSGNSIWVSTPFIGRQKEKGIITDVLHKLKIKDSSTKTLIIQGEGNSILSTQVTVVSWNWQDTTFNRSCENCR